MKKGKVIIVIAACLLIPLTGFLIINSIFGDGRKKSGINGSEVSASQMSPDDRPSGSNNKDNPQNTYNPPSDEYDGNNTDVENNDMTNDHPSSDTWVPATTMDLDPSSITVYVNKEYALPRDYVPDDLVVPNVKFDIEAFDERKQMRREAAYALEELFAAAEKAGYELCGISGYRSYDRQKTIFLNNIVTRGKDHTLKYSAVPGTSEHQTGLAMDLSSKSMRYRLVTTFSSSSEGKWIAENAHHYGYIVRYPEDRIDITGYAYEPWHIRYVGRDLATYLYENNLTLDEYYNYKPSEGFDFEAIYADLINYVPPATPTPIPYPITIIPAGTILEGDLTLPENTSINGSITLVKDLKLKDGTILPEGTVLSGTIILPKNTVLNCIIILPVDVVVEDGIVLPEGAIIADGDPLPDGTFLECSLTLPTGTLLESDVLLPKGTRLENAVLMQEAIIPGSNDLADIIPDAEDDEDDAPAEEGSDLADELHHNSNDANGVIPDIIINSVKVQGKDTPGGEDSQNGNDTANNGTDVNTGDAQNDEDTQSSGDTRNNGDAQSSDDTQSNGDAQSSDDTQSNGDAQSGGDTQNNSDSQGNGSSRENGDTAPEANIPGNINLPKGTILNLGNVLPEGAVLDFGTVIYIQYAEF